MAKLNPTTMKTQYDGQYDTFCRKNHDYDNSFEESLDQFGIIASLVRMQDKMLRLQSLTDESKTQQVGSESLLDTLEDLSNYAAMTACWLKGVQAEDDVINKSYHAVKDLIETCDDSDVKYNELYHKRMLNSLYGAHIFRTPGENWQMTQCENGFKPLGAEIETELPEETIGMYIDRMLSELYSRIDVWGYNDQEQYHEFVNFAETTVKEIIKNNVPISELQKHIDVFPNFSQAYKNSLKSQCMKEYNKVEQVRPNKEDEEMKKLIEASEEVVCEKHDHSDIVDIFRYNMQAAKDTMKFWRKPGTPFTPLGPEIIPEPKLDESLYNYIKENVDDCVTRICQLMSRGELPTIGGIEHWTYNIGRCAIDHYEDPYTIIEHVKDMPSFRVLSDKNARLVIDSIKNYITDFNKEKEASKLTDEAYDFLEEHVDRAVGYMTHVRAHGKVPQRLDVCDYAYDIARFAVEHYEDPFVIIQHMNQINSISVLDDDDIMLLHTSITNYIQEIIKKGPTFDKPVKPTDHLKKFVEEVTNDIISVVLMKQRDEKMLVPADLDDDTSRIIKCITDNEFDPNYVVSYMEALMGNAGIPPYLREWIRGIILRGVYYRNKGRSMTKAKDKARGVMMKGSRGNSNVIVMASRGSGKGLMKTKSLLEELGVPKEDIKEIFEGLEDNDE